MLAGAKHVSCTIEMVSTIKQWDCAVIDEIQVLPTLQEAQRSLLAVASLQLVLRGRMHCECCTRKYEMGQHGHMATWGQCQAALAD